VNAGLGQRLPDRDGGGRRAGLDHAGGKLPLNPARVGVTAAHDQYVVLGDHNGNCHGERRDTGCLRGIDLIGLTSLQLPRKPDLLRDGRPLVGGIECALKLKLTS
jgi:hypothetical protein